MTANRVIDDSRPNTMDSAELSECKAQMRQEAAERRLAAWCRDPDAGTRLTRHLLDAKIVPAGAIVSGYWPLDGEMDVRPALMALHACGHTICLPVVVAKGAPLLFRRWQPEMELVAGSFRVLTPPGTSPEVRPDVLLVPLLAFDHSGYRLGYGGGFYDRTLAKLRPRGHVTGAHAIGIGIAFAVQEVGDVPRGPYDTPLDFVATEVEIIRVKNKENR